MSGQKTRQKIVTHVGPEYILFAKAIKNMLVRRTPASVRSSMVARAASRRDCHRAWLTDGNGPDGPLKQQRPEGST